MIIADREEHIMVKTLNSQVSNRSDGFDVMYFQFCDCFFFNYFIIIFVVHGYECKTAIMWRFIPRSNHTVLRGFQSLCLCKYTRRDARCIVLAFVWFFLQNEYHCRSDPPAHPVHRKTSISLYNTWPTVTGG